MRAKVHAEASAVCATCGRRHLLDSHCSAALHVVHEASCPPVEAPDGDADVAVERDATLGRRLVASVITYLGLDAASFGAVDDRDLPPLEAVDLFDAIDGPAPSGARRVIAFLGIDVSTVGGARGDDDDDDDDDNDDDDDGPVTEPEGSPADEYERAPAGDETAGTVAADEVAPSVTVVMTAADDHGRQYWSRADDDILYRPSRRPRSPRRTWRARRARVTPRD